MIVQDLGFTSAGLFVPTNVIAIDLEMIREEPPFIIFKRKLETFEPIREGRREDR